MHGDGAITLQFQELNGFARLFALMTPGAHMSVLSREYSSGVEICKAVAPVDPLRDVHGSTV